VTRSNVSLAILTAPYESYRELPVPWTKTTIYKDYLGVSSIPALVDADSFAAPGRFRSKNTASDSTLVQDKRLWHRYCYGFVETFGYVIDCIAECPRTPFLDKGGFDYQSISVRVALDKFTAVGGVQTSDLSYNASQYENLEFAVSADSTYIAAVVAGPSDIRVTLFNMSFGGYAIGGIVSNLTTTTLPSGVFVPSTLRIVPDTANSNPSEFIYSLMFDSSGGSTFLTLSDGLLVTGSNLSYVNLAKPQVTSRVIGYNFGVSARDYRTVYSVVVWDSNEVDIYAFNHTASAFQLAFKNTLQLSIGTPLLLAQFADVVFRPRDDFACLHVGYNHSDPNSMLYGIYCFDLRDMLAGPDHSILSPTYSKGYFDVTERILGADIFISENYELCFALSTNFLFAAHCQSLSTNSSTVISLSDVKRNVDPLYPTAFDIVAKGGSYCVLASLPPQSGNTNVFVYCANQFTQIEATLSIPGASIIGTISAAFNPSQTEYEVLIAYIRTPFSEIPL